MLRCNPGIIHYKRLIPVGDNNIQTNVIVGIMSINNMIYCPCIFTIYEGGSRYSSQKAVVSLSTKFSIGQ